MSIDPPTQPTPAGPADAAAAGSEGVRLEGWKAIATHLNRDIRTVQRWELTEQLPVHREEHGQRAVAFAWTGELDAWTANRVRRGGVAGPDSGTHQDGGQAAPGRPARARVMMAAAAVILAAAAFAFWLARREPAPRFDTRDQAAYSAFAEGTALYAARQYAPAAAALERAVARDPSYGAAWALLAKTYGRQAQPVWSGGADAGRRAADAARRARELAPHEPEVHIGLALAARAAGHVTEWRAAAQRALELDPRAAEALALLGDSYAAVVYACGRDEDPERAEDYYRRAMELMPAATTTASNRAGNLRRLGRYAECVTLLNQAIRSYRDEIPLRAVRGGCRLMLGDLAGATEDIAPLRDNPKIAHAGSFVYLGLLELKRGNTEQGVRDLESVIRFDPSARTELIVAEAYGLAGDEARVTAHLQRALALEPACARTVASSLAFKPVRQMAGVKALLAAVPASRRP